MAATIPPIFGKHARPQDLDAHASLVSPGLPQESLPEDERMQQVERIAGSEALQKSSRLPALLRYLAICTLSNNRAGLTEQAIGWSVFEKSRDFHPTEDSSVRVYVRQLRLRLHEFYQSAGQSDAVVIDIPKGGYALAFHYRPGPDHRPAIALLEDGLSRASPDMANTDSHRLRHWLPWALLAVVCLVALTGWVGWYDGNAAAKPPWPLNQVVEPGRPTTVVLADASYALRLLGDRQFTLDEYADQKYTSGLIPKDATRGELTLFHYLQDSQITSMADARAVSAITTLAGSLRGSLLIRSAKELSGGSLSTGNFIIVGAKNSNPWVELYEPGMNFRLVEGGIHGARYIDNRAPNPGEQPFYAIRESTGYSGEDYATISLVPGFGDQGSTLLLQGLRREGTEAAVQFLSSPTRRATLEQKLRKANSGILPKYFEALLQSHAVAGSATSIDCIAARPLAPPNR